MTLWPGGTICIWSVRTRLTQATVLECDVPIASALDRHRVADAYFKDAYSTALSQADVEVVDLFAAVFAHHPLWIKLALIVRNRLASIAGLDVPKVSDILHPTIKTSYVVGDQIGPWPLFYLSETELIAGRNNGHLDFRLSVLKQADAKVVISTICNVHNRWGKIYLFFIEPFHRWGVRRLIADAVSAGRL